jgi:hypothetical protein
MPWLDETGAPVSDPQTLQTLGYPSQSAPPPTQPAAPTPGGTWQDSSGATVTDPATLKSLGDEGASGPFGAASPGEWPHMGNWAAGQLRDLGQSTMTSGVRAGGGLLDQLYGMAGPEYGGNDPGTKLASKFFDIVPPYQPKTGLGKGLMSTTEGAIAGAPFGPAAAVLGGVGGAATETAGALTGDNPYAKFLAGLGVPLVLGHQYGRFSSPEAMVARRMSPSAPPERNWRPSVVTPPEQQTTPPQRDAAADLQQRSNTIGAPLLSTEALNSPPVHQLTADVMASPHGASIYRAITQERPDEVRRAVSNEILDPITAQPIDPSTLGPRAQGDATQAMRDTEAARTAQSSPWFQRAATQNVTGAQLQPILDDLNRQIALQGPATAARRELVRLRDSIGDEHGFVNNTQIGPIHSVQQDYFARTNYDPANPDAVSKSVTGIVTPQANAIERVLQTNSDFAAGRWVHGHYTPPVERAQALPLRDIAATDNVPTQYRAITNPDTARPDNIRETAAALNAQNRETFPQLARSYFENTFARTQKGSRVNPDNPASGVDFALTVNGTPEQRANNRAILEGVAAAHGVPPADLITGFNNAIEVFDRMGKIPGVGSPTVQRGQSQAEASRGPGTSLPEIISAEPLNPFIHALKGMYYRRAYRTLAAAIVSPDGVRQLQQLSLMNPGSRQAQAIVGTMIGISMGTDESPPTPGRPPL